MMTDTFASSSPPQVLKACYAPSRAQFDASQLSVRLGRRTCSGACRPDCGRELLVSNGAGA